MLSRKLQKIVFINQPRRGYVNTIYTHIMARAIPLARKSFQAELGDWLPVTVTDFCLSDFFLVTVKSFVIGRL